MKLSYTAVTVRHRKGTELLQGAFRQKLRKVQKTMTKEQLNDVRDHILDTAINRRNCGSMAGKLKKDRTPNQELKNSETEFFMGAYTCLTKMMSIVDEITIDKSMKYFLPSVMFTVMRGGSVIDELTKDRKQ